MSVQAQDRKKLGKRKEYWEGLEESFYIQRHAPYSDKDVVIQTCVFENLSSYTYKSLNYSSGLKTEK